MRHELAVGPELCFFMFNKPDKTPQLSGYDGVTSTVSSLAIDHGMLSQGAGQGSFGFAGADEAATGALPRSEQPACTLAALTDAEVMLRVKAGDDGAFTYLVEKFRRPIVGFMYRMTHNSAVAEELAQEVFLRVYRSRESYKAEAKFTTWLYRIATNLAVNHARDSRHERAEVTVSLDEPDEDTGTTPDLADRRQNVEQSLLARERLAAIRQHVMALPERQRMAVIMHKYQDMDYRSIAEVLKLSEPATKSLLFRAYETLRERLKSFV